VLISSFDSRSDSRGRRPHRVTCRQNPARPWTRMSGQGPVVCLGRGPVARASRLLAIERACTAPEPCAPLMAAAARVPDCRSPRASEQGCEARSRCRSLMKRDRHRPPGSVQMPGHIRAEHLECSRNGLYRCLNVLARPVRRSPGRDAAPPIPARRVSSRRRDFPSPSASPAARTPRLDARCPCHVGPAR
jgi:hypothetical protein